MKTLFCCGTATQTGQGQASIWRWWHYYRPLHAEFKATHYAISNDSHENLPTEGFVDLYDGSKPLPFISDKQLSIVYWPTSLPRQGIFSSPGYCRGVSTLAKLAFEQGFSKMIYVAWDAFILSPRMMTDVSDVATGLVTYWSEFYTFPECNIFTCSRDHLLLLSNYADTLSKKESCDLSDMPENYFPWTEVRRNMVGDRYPEKSTPLPASADFCTQVPIFQAVSNGALVSLAVDRCRTCGGELKFSKDGPVMCSNCFPSNF